MHIINIIICNTFLVFVKVISSNEQRTVGETREILIINSMKLWQMEIKLQSNWFSCAIMRSRWARCSRARAPLHVRVSYAGINIRVISRSSYRNEIVNGLANSDFTLQWIDNETIEHLPIEAYVQFRPWRVQYPKFLSKKFESKRFSINYGWQKYG